ncbi:MAG: hypothetical protein M0R06_19995 [Sphaerochaeta sp.]|jgi:hypothetical protein|nr:hypothetical protein [Sphaerochaeta sp.]
MAKIGTAHVEIKPVLNEEALEALCAQVEEASANAVIRAMQSIRVAEAAKRGMLRALYGDTAVD